MRQLIKKSVAAFLKTLYPKACLHCGQEAEAFLCRVCGESLELLRQEMTPTLGLSSLGCAFEKEEVITSLVTYFRKPAYPYLAKGLATFLSVQWHRLQWTLPDFIVAVSKDDGEVAAAFARGLGVPQLFLHRWLQWDFRQESCFLKDATIALIQVEYHKILLEGCVQQLLPYKTKGLHVLAFCQTEGACSAN